MGKGLSREWFDKIASPEAVAEFDKAHGMREWLQAKIDKQDAARGRPLTDEERLANLADALSRCDSCEKKVEPDWLYCAWCGYNLMEE